MRGTCAGEGTTERSPESVHGEHAGGATTRYTRDAFGRVVSIADPAGGVTELGWTVEGKQAWLRQPDGATQRWLYDGEGNETRYVDAAGGDRQAAHAPRPGWGRRSMSGPRSRRSRRRDCSSKRDSSRRMLNSGLRWGELS
ncbi:RHS repeat domain-containing protein [Amycolatopsis sp. DG1A-15b]|uniref:RHS repeat domain-containing protein n=1 Tax=Amycolatopsis sp. DG1A-15b TaxID=3052846 RepID=UPI00255BF953|nr:RHS repeat domain-containing protein [Amycolatopsis sp. DG1A-15b]WIX93368.1 YD repeat-containing protein [Amycolatopsis sp. DG1A-15b]